LIAEILLASTGGLLLHQAKRITIRAPHGWRELTDHTIGVVGTLPFAWLFWRRLDTAKPPHRAIAACLLAFLCVGIGVAFGWLLDTLQDKSR
jgi:hypothetical protein